MKLKAYKTPWPVGTEIEYSEGYKTSILLSSKGGGIIGGFYLRSPAGRKCTSKSPAWFYLNPRDLGKEAFSWASWDENPSHFKPTGKIFDGVPRIADDQFKVIQKTAPHSVIFSPSDYPDSSLEMERKRRKKIRSLLRMGLLERLVK